MLGFMCMNARMHVCLAAAPVEARRMHRVPWNRSEILTVIFDTGSHYTALAGLKLTELHLPLPSGSWD